MDAEILYKSANWKYADYKKLAIEAKDDIQAIRAEIYDEISSDANLSALNSPSRVSIWQLILDLVAFILWVNQAQWELYKAELEQLAANAIPHTALWYANKAKEFQLGDFLNDTNGVVAYPVINLNNRIVKQASVREAGGKLFIKIAKDVSGNLQPLSTAELVSFRGYMNNISDAGVQLEIITANADLLKLEIDVYYDAINNNINSQTYAAINAYIQGLPFDGVFRRTGLVDALQKVSGVRDVEIKVCEATIAYTSTPQYVPVPVFYDTIAGYLRIDPAFPLSSSVNFIPYV